MVPDKVGTVIRGVRNRYPYLCLDQKDFDPGPSDLRSLASKETEGGYVFFIFFSYMDA
ncbi:hypothetical protein SDC9_204639 [bioreactor metagenome]|uniref:Uncharacterized protein n=1 Tax=bioreactor metagenome TaxID=1076179 RepID=A0A645J0H3_9ZZZZ